VQEARSRFHALQSAGKEIEKVAARLPHSKKNALIVSGRGQEFFSNQSR